MMEDDQKKKKYPQAKMDSTQLKEKKKKQIQQKAVQRNSANSFGADFSGKGAMTSMPKPVQQKMENSFGADFSNVAIHKDSGSAINMGALAYAQGNEIHFAPGQYNPETRKGQELLGHELTHVVQQRQGRVQATTQQGKGMAVNDDPALEREADVMGAKAAHGEKAFGMESSTSIEESKNVTSSSVQMKQKNKYEIRSGDTYWSLVKNSGGQFTVENLKKWNPGIDPRNLQIGQKINLSDPSKAKETSGEKNNAQNEIQDTEVGTVDNTRQALDHYFNGNGVPVRLGLNTTRALFNSKDFQSRHIRIVTGQTTSLEGNFSVDLTGNIFHVGRTNVDYSIDCIDSDNCKVTYILFVNDGFWDVDFLDENILGRLGLRDYQPDGLGPNLERFGGTPYSYIPLTVIQDFSNPGY